MWPNHCSNEECYGKCGAADHKKSYKTKKEICFLYSRRKLKCTKREDCPQDVLSNNIKISTTVIKEITGCLRIAQIDMGRSLVAISEF